mmetsp:Transcript_74445/g.230943  ORF Transcript_74445/g.230943 Transcript_74445/m.230943 type:complete len:405 (-) Transcript_74445:38-1252(-)
MVASNIKVYLRVRPCAKPSPTFKADGEKGSVTFELEKQAPDSDVNNTKLSHGYRFDGVLLMKTSQEDVLEVVAKPVIDDVLNGVNGTIFAYGQTGSGKTHTMAGGTASQAAGVIPRAVDLIFAEVEELRQKGWRFEVSATALEVYNEAVCDLLAPRQGSEPCLGAVPTAQAGASSAGTEPPQPGTGAACSAQRVRDAAAVHALLRRAARERHVAATACNDRSSRSHSVFQLSIEGACDSSGTRREVRGLLSLVDLAGSERVEKSGATGDRLREAQHINRSLSALGDVVEALARRGQPGGAGVHVPYRNSRLTSLLKDSLGGESKALMFVNVSPCSRHLTETISSLRFASKVHACNVGVAKRCAVVTGADTEVARRSAVAVGAGAQGPKARRSRSCPASPGRGAR